MPPANKRKTEKAALAVSEQENAPAQQAQNESERTPEESDSANQPKPPSQSTDAAVEEQAPTSKPPAATATCAATKASDRLARFRALQERAKKSSDQNLAEAAKESARLSSDPSALTALHRKRDIAQHKLLRAEAEEAGEDFERKRAWDWTIEESERWDKRLKKKAAHRDNNAFQDYRGESNKVYKRQLRDMSADMEKYDKDKMAAIEKAAASGGLDIVETEDGELIAVDKDGTFYSTADTTSFAEHKPDKAAVDRLVEDMKKAEDARLKKRRDRMAANGDDGDVTYINEKNKQFNDKLSRFYNKYTREIRDSFERGTMI